MVVMQTSFSAPIDLVGGRQVARTHLRSAARLKAVHVLVRLALDGYDIRTLRVRAIRGDHCALMTFEPSEDIGVVNELLQRYSAGASKELEVEFVNVHPSLLATAVLILDYAR